MIAAPAIGCGVGVGVGLIGLVVGWDKSSGKAVGPRGRGMGPLMRAQAPRIAVAVAAGVVAGMATGWPIAGPMAAAAAYGLPKLLNRTTAEVSIEKLEAVATWTEMLQGTLAASAGLTQAIIATAPLAPAVLQEATGRLSARLSAGALPHYALLQFADELGDPSVDRVVCALVLAVSARAQRLGDLLSALADSTRDEVALRLRIETSRSSVRSGVRTVVLFSVAFATGLTVLAHTYLQPFGSAAGQVVLAVVGLCYAVGLVAMVSLSRPPAPVRLLGPAVAKQ
jgi:tight adherence protein B